MQERVDASPAFQRFERLFPRALAREVLVEQGIASHEPQEVARSLPAATAFIREIADEHGIDQGAVDLVVEGMQHPFDASEIDDAHVEGVCRHIVGLWLKALDEVRDFVDAPEPIALTERLLPDASSIRGEEDVGELVEAAAGTIESAYTMISVDRAWRLFDAFVAATHAATAGMAERIEISATTTLVIADGRFSLEKSPVSVR